MRTHSGRPPPVGPPPRHDLSAAPGADAGRLRWHFDSRFASKSDGARVQAPGAAENLTGSHIGPARSIMRIQERSFALQPCGFCVVQKKPRGPQRSETAERPLNCGRRRPVAPFSGEPGGVSSAQCSAAGECARALRQTCDRLPPTSSVFRRRARTAKK